MTEDRTRFRGFASMTSEQRAKIASMGGKASSGNFKHDPARAALAGARGGQVSGGNFKKNPERAAILGSRGGLAKAGAQ